MRVTRSIERSMPKTATGTEQTPPQPESHGSPDYAAFVADAAAKQAPPPPGLGRFLDKTV
jgi:hypothetical protein